MFDWFKKDNSVQDGTEDVYVYGDDSVDEDTYTKRDFKITVLIVLGLLCLYNIGGLFFDKAKCAYTGYTYEKPTKRPIFSECLIKMKDGSYVPLERYINRVISFNDLGNGGE